MNPDLFQWLGLIILSILNVELARQIKIHL